MRSAALSRLIWTARICSGAVLIIALAAFLLGRALPVVLSSALWFAVLLVALDVLHLVWSGPRSGC